MISHSQQFAAVSPVVPGLYSAHVFVNVFSITAPIVAICIFVVVLFVYVSPASKILRSPTTPSEVVFVTNAVPFTDAVVQSDIVDSVPLASRTCPVCGIFICRAFTAL